MSGTTWVDLVCAAASRPCAQHADVAAWHAGFGLQPDSFLSALNAGLGGGQLAFCFAGGYQAAVRRLVPGLPDYAFAALLLTEGKRQRPEELETRLTALPEGGFRLDGEKSYLTGGELADTWLVVARQESAGEPPRTALLVLPAGLPGASVLPRPAIGLLDALPHARARFDGVRVDAPMVSPGDGWRDYARPFRTLEDIHVSVAVAAHLAAEALRAGWPDRLLAVLMATLARLADCASREAGDPVGHLLLAAAEQELQQVAAQVNDLLAGRDDAFARDWQANRLLLALAAPARGKRLERAAASLRALAANGRE